MLEKDFQQWIVDTATHHGWRCWHVPTPMKPIGSNKFVPDPRGRGLPDLFMMHSDPPRLILAEVKGPDGVLSDAQKEFLHMAREIANFTRDGNERLQGAIIGVYVWQPGGEAFIEDILRGKVLAA